MVRRLRLKESDNNTLDNFMIALKDIPDKDIDHYETDLYLRKTPATTKLINTVLPNSFKKNVTTFIDNIDHVPWYEIPFAFPGEINRKGTMEKESVIMEDDNIETYDVHFWDKEEEESYNHKIVHMTSYEVKDYVDKLNAKRDDYDKYRGFWDYVLV